MQNLKNSFFINFRVSPKVNELQRCTIHHFKALDSLFWLLAWLLTLGSITFVVWSKTFVHFFFAHLLQKYRKNEEKFYFSICFNYRVSDLIWNTTIVHVPWYFEVSMIHPYFTMWILNDPILLPKFINPISYN